MKKIKRMAALLLAMTMSASVSVSAMAAEYTQIDDVSFDIIHNIEIDEYDCEVDVSISSGMYELEQVKITNEPDEAWEDGDKPKVTVELWVTDEDKYRFASGIKKADITIDENDGKVTSVSRGSSGKKLTVKVELPKLERDPGFYEDALVVEGIAFDEGNGIGYWEENEYADRYEVKLYRNDSYIAGTFKTSDLDYDFSQYFTRKGTYVFQVRGLRDRSGSSTDFKGDWADSEEIYVDSDEAKEIRLYGGYGESSSSGSSTTNSSSGNGPGNSSNNSNANATGPASKNQMAAGGWIKNANGWWWCNPDRTYPANAWKEIDGVWYYFDPNGYCLMNSWIKSQESGLWYYCGDTGAMVTNNWVLSNNKYYYCGPDGAMWTSRRTPDGYYVDSNGVWIQ